MTRILGIDPGSRITGYGVIEAGRDGLRYLASGVIRAGKGPFPQRLLHIHTAMSELATQYRPSVAAVEQVFVHRNVDSALKLGHARGAAICGCMSQGLEVAEYTPRAVKQAIVGKGGAEKSQVQYMVQVLLALPGAPSEDAADALAVAVCHAHQPRLSAALGVS